MDTQKLRTLLESPMVKERENPVSSKQYAALGTEEQKIIKSLEENLGIPNLIARILYGRGITSPEDAEAFLYPNLENLSDPFLLPDMDKGARRVIEAITNKENICLYGDYDADGITSLALMVNFFRHLEMTPATYIPHRKEGYGLNIQAIDRLKANGASLLICLDCGSTNIEEIRRAKELSIDTIVIDHHELPNASPEAYALINPKRSDSRFPTRELAACGVTFFFLLALRRSMFSQGLLKHKINLKKELDIVTIGTIGDMVPLTKDNRIIVKFGMDTMKKKPRTWLKTFFKMGIISDGSIDEYALNFVIIPRINAAGRVSEPEKSLNFLVCDNESDSMVALKELCEANRERQKIEGDILKEIVDIVNRDKLADGNSIVLFKEDWHMGVVGIVAQKLVEMFGKPSIIITEVEGMWKGSGRGGDGMDLHETIKTLSHLLIKFGGHKYACGILLSKENLVPFQQAFENSVRGILNNRKKGVSVDAHADFEELTGELVECMELLAPFGIGNPRPNLLLTPLDMSINNKFVKVIDRNNKTWYGNIQRQSQIPQYTNMSIVAAPVIREEMGEKFIHLNIKKLIPVDDMPM